MGIKSFFKKLFCGGNPATEKQKPRPARNRGSKHTPERRTAENVKITPAEQKKHLRTLEEFVEYVAKALVDHPEDVAVSAGDSPDGKMIRISCRAEDRGKIIGKKGKTIIALRSLASGAAGRFQMRVSVEVLDGGRAEGKN